MPSLKLDDDQRGWRSGPAHRRLPHECSNLDSSTLAPQHDAWPSSPRLQARSTRVEGGRCFCSAFLLVCRLLISRSKEPAIFSVDSDRAFAWFTPLTWTCYTSGADFRRGHGALASPTDDIQRFLIPCTQSGNSFAWVSIWVSLFLLHNNNHLREFSPL